MALRALVLTSILLAAHTAFAKGPAGSEFQANTYTTYDQGRGGVAVASDGSGNFVVVWASSYGQDGDGNGVFGRRFGSSGTALGAEFQVNTYTTADQGRGGLALAAAAAGEFVVVWNSYYQDGSSWGIFGQRFDGAGSPQGGEFQVNTYTTGGQSDYRPGLAVAADSAGNFVVVWSSYGQDGDGQGVFGQRFDSAGSSQGGEFQVNTYTTGNQG
jgi:hypothetical protein